MLVSKSIVSLFAIVVAGTAAALGMAGAHGRPVANGSGSRHDRRRNPRPRGASRHANPATRRGRSRLSALLQTARTPRAGRIQSPGTTSAALNAGGSIDPNEIARLAVERGRALMKEGKPQDALTLYLATYREVQPFRPGSSACQRLMGEMKYLGRTHPPALTALAQLRDAALRQLQAQPARRGELSFEIALLNGRLDQADRTLALRLAHISSAANVVRAAESHKAAAFELPNRGSTRKGRKGGCGVSLWQREYLLAHICGPSAALARIFHALLASDPTRCARIKSTDSTVLAMRASAVRCAPAG